MHITVTNTLSAIPAASWDRLVDAREPFLSHTVLYGMEAHGCLEGQGWQSSHLLAYEDTQLVGAMPLYLRDNSYGEFVFVCNYPAEFKGTGNSTIAFIAWKTDCPFLMAESMTERMTANS